MPKSIGKPVRLRTRRKNQKPVNTVIHISQFTTHKREPKELTTKQIHRKGSNTYAVKYEHGNKTIVSKKIYVRGVASDKQLRAIMKREIKSFSKNKRKEITFSAQHYQGRVQSHYTAQIEGKKTPAARITSIRKYRTKYEKVTRRGYVGRKVVGQKKRSAKQLYEDFEDVYVVDFMPAYESLSFQYEVSEDDVGEKIGKKRMQSQIKGKKGKKLEQSSNFDKLKREAQELAFGKKPISPTLTDEAFVRGFTISGIPMRRKEK
jgi:hypothetical protein